MKKKKYQNENLRVAIIFFILVGVLIFLSLSFKISSVLANSGFDGKHRYTLKINQDNNLTIISFSPQNKSIVILKTSDKNIAKNLEIPIDSEIFLSSKIEKESLTSDLFKILVSVKNRNSEPTIVDAFRFLVLSKTIPQNQIKEINASDSPSYFTDQSVAQDRTTIEIVNGTSVFGLGGRLTNLITNMGGNVILVSTAEREARESKILYSKENYTVKKLEKILGFKKEQLKEKSIANVIIIIGKDNLSSLKF